MTEYTKAALFGEIGKRTPMFARFSTVAGEQASPTPGATPAAASR